jgi:hypothetical protein
MGEDPDAAGAELQGEIVLAVQDLRNPHAGTGDVLVAGDYRTGMDLPHPADHPELGQSLGE